MDNSVWAVVGGDARQAALARLLAAEGNTVYCAALDEAVGSMPGAASTDPGTAIRLADYVILPMPPTRDGTTLFAPLSRVSVPLDDKLCTALRGKTVFVGMASRLRAVSEAYAALPLRDYYESEPFLLRNARATAEGTLAEIILHSPRTVCGSRILLTGCGRITRSLAPMLRQLGAGVSVAARGAADRAWAESVGIEGLTFPKAARCAGQFAVIVNTVPAPVIGADWIEAIASAASDPLLLELASAPGGIDADACERHALRLLRAPGLPGRTSPLSAAENIKETVMLSIEEG